MAQSRTKVLWKDSDKQKVYRLLDAGASQGQVSRDTGIPQPTICRWDKARRELALTNGDAETTAETVAIAVRNTPDHSTLQPIVQSIVQPVVETIVPRLDAHESRLFALETWLTTFQQRPELATPTLQTTARLHTEPTRPRSIQMETDLFDTLKAFCQAEHRQMKEVVDTTLAAFFASHGWTIAEGGRDA